MRKHKRTAAFLLAAALMVTQFGNDILPTAASALDTEQPIEQSIEQSTEQVEHTETVLDTEITQQVVGNDTIKTTQAPVQLMDTKAAFNGGTALNLHGNNPTITAYAPSMENEFGEACYPFSYIRLGVPGGTYQNGDTCSFFFAISLDDDYLAAVRDAEENTSELPKIQAKIALSDQLTLKDEQKSGNLTDASGEQVGTFELVSESGVTALVITMNNVVYTKAGVLANASADLCLNASSNQEGDEYQLAWDNANEIVSVSKKSVEEDPTEKLEDYQLVKTAEPTVDKPYIDYTIDVTANNGKTLAGMMLKDAIPSTDLTVTSVTVDGAVLSEADTPKKDGTEYQIAQNTLNYTFPADATNTTAQFVVRMELTTDAYKSLVNDKKGQWDKNYKNTAKLMTGDGNTQKAVSAETSTDMKITTFDKVGAQDNSDSMKINWTITVNTSGMGMKDTYLVDRISKKQMQYVAGASALTVVMADGTKTKVALDKVTDEAAALISANSSYAYNSLKAMTTSAACELCAAIATGTGAVYYEQGDDYIFVMPYASAYTGQSVQIKYATRMVSANQANVGVSGADSQKATNDATMFWRFVSGPGTEETPYDFQFSLSKNTDVSYKLISKSAGTYDEATQTMQWKLKTNSYDIALTKAKITDTIGAGQEYVADSLVYAKNKSASYLAVPAYTAEDTKYPSYEVSGDKKTITIHVGALGASDYYNFRYNSKVTEAAQGAAILATQCKATDTNASKLGNTVKMEADYDGKNLSSEVTAEKSIPNTLITKQVTKKYDAKTHLIEWKATINPNHIPIDSGVITDVLPHDTTFGELTALQIISAEGNISTSSLSDIDTYLTVDSSNQTEVVDGITRETKKFTYVNSTDDTNTYILTYTTKVTDAYRSANHTKDSFVNDVRLAGTVGAATIHDQSNVSYAAASAATPVTITAIAKTSVNNGDGRIKWSIFVNTGAAPMAGTIVMDDITSQQIELQADKNYFSITNVDVAADGSYQAQATVREDSATLVENAVAFTKSDSEGEEDGFTFTIPDGLKTTPFVLNFYTFATEGIDRNVVSNTAKLKENEGGEDDEVASSTNTFADSYGLDAYAQMKGIPILRLVKSSSRGEAICLSGAQYTLTTCAPVEGDGTTYKAAPKTKQRTTDGKGAVVFTNLKSNYLYSVQETAAPAGYTLDSTPHYYMFIANDSEKLAVDSNGEISITNTTDDSVIKVEVQNITYLTLDDAVAVPVQHMKNTPSADIIFTKNGEDATPLSGVTFTLKRDGGQKEWDSTQTVSVTTGSDGIVKFADIDPGTYTLTETNAPENYKLLGGSVKLTVSDADTYTYTASGAIAKLITASNGQLSAVKNLIQKADVTFTKLDNNEEILSGVQFHLVKNDGTAAAQTKTTDTEGKLTFTGLTEGSYRIDEVLPEDELNQSADSLTQTQATFHIAANGTMSELVLGEQAQTITGEPTLAGDAQEIHQYNIGVIHNTIKYGYVDLCKVSDETIDGVSQPIKDTVFAIYRGAETTPYITGIKTDAQGRLIRNDNGSYGKEEKFLTYGTYYLVEAEATTGFAVNTLQAAFTIGADTTGHQGTAWISMPKNGDAANVTYYNSSQTISITDTYRNAALRYPIELHKTDYQDSARMNSGAVYTIATEEGTTVATLTEGDKEQAPGVYDTLTSVAGNERYTSLNGTKVSYVRDNKLIPGTYQMTETTVPDGYYATDFTMTVGADGKITVEGAHYVLANGTAQMQSSLVSVEEVSQAQIIQVKERSLTTLHIHKTDRSGHALDGAVFTLTCETQGASSAFADRETDSVTLTSDETGVLRDVSGKELLGVLIAGYTYKLVETTPPDGYEAPLTTDGSAKAYLTITVADDDTMSMVKNGLTASMDGSSQETITIINDNTRVTLHKYDSTSQEGIAGVTFLVSFEPESAQDGEAYSKRSYQTNDNGDIRLSELRKGIYTIEEEVPQGYDTAKGFHASFTLGEKDLDRELVLNSTNASRLSFQSGAASLTEKGIANERLTGSITLKKMDSATKAELKDVTFTLYKKNEVTSIWDAIRDFLTGNSYTRIDETNYSAIAAATDGELKIDYLTWGEYKLVETRPLEGYRDEQATRQFTVDAAQQNFTWQVSGEAIYNEALITVSGTVGWLDSDNYFGTRPENIKLSVTRADGDKLECTPQITWTKNGNQWSYVITGLNRYDRNLAASASDAQTAKAAELTYIITEDKPAHYHTQTDATEQKTEESFTITGTQGSDARALDENSQVIICQTDAQGNVTHVDFNNCVDTSLRKLGINNTTDNPSNASKHNVGGKVTVDMGTHMTPDHADCDENQLNQVLVSWLPDENWTNTSSFSIGYYETIDGKKKTIEVHNYLDEAGNVRAMTDSCYASLLAVFPQATLTKQADGVMRLVLADSADTMPISTSVDVGFAPTLAVKNSTSDYTGGKVTAEGGTASAKADGIQAIDGKAAYQVRKVAGYAEEGYQVDLKHLTLANLRSSSTDPKGTQIGEVTIEPKADGTFSTTVKTVLAGVETALTVTGKVTSVTDANGRVVSVLVSLDQLDIPLEVGITFAAYSAPPIETETDTTETESETETQSTEVTETTTGDSSGTEADNVSVSTHPKTGDNSAPGLYAVVMLLALTVLVTLGNNRRKTKHNRK